MDLSTLSPADAAVALRGFERRYRGLFAGLGDDESPDDIARRQVGGWSAIDHVVAAARAMSAADRALAAVLTSDSPTLAPSDVLAEARPHPGTPTGPVHERLAELGFEAVATADRIERVAATDWQREGTVSDGSGRRVSALDLARLAVDAGVTHLREARKVLDAVTG
jgi:hypothetical protein